MTRDAAASAQAGQGTGPLSADLVAFVQSGITVLIGAGDPRGEPVAGFGFSCVVDETAGELRVLVDPRGSAPLLAALRAGGSVAASFTDLEHRSIQAKGARARIETPTERDLEALVRQSRGHRDWLALAGFAPAFCQGFVRCDPAAAVVVAFAPEQAFRQTPGPGAGEAIQAFPDPLGRAERRP
ncbi:MAG: hypothetical protein ACU0DT_19845 [Albimonas sp.]|uniref:hypothetical protein n=1 Tax=Albimonas sp. TaxID=1872425 RepID=UPI004057380F